MIIQGLPLWRVHMFTPLLKSGGREEQKESPHFAAHVRMDFQSFRFWFWERGGNPLDHSQEVSPRILICHLRNKYWGLP